MTEEEHHRRNQLYLKLIIYGIGTGFLAGVLLFILVIVFGH